MARETTRKATREAARGIESAVASHYARADLLDAILAAADAAGCDRKALRPEDLAPVDEFHTAGRLATLKALELLPLAPDMHVLDVGCGIGGTARHIAAGHGCRVTGIDLTPEYVAVAQALTERMGLAARCTFVEASALAIPCADASFDAAVSFHVAMNIADRPALYHEVARVVRPSARFCIFDVMKGPTSGMRYPVPWAETAETSVLKSAAETRALLDAAGFAVEQESNLRAFAIEYFDKVFARIAEAGGPPPLGLHLLTGANSGDKFANYAAVLGDHQIEPVIMVARRR